MPQKIRLLCAEFQKLTRARREHVSKVKTLSQQADQLSREVRSTKAEIEQMEAEVNTITADGTYRKVFTDMQQIASRAG